MNEPTNTFLLVGNSYCSKGKGDGRSQTNHENWTWRMHSKLKLFFKWPIQLECDVCVCVCLYVHNAGRDRSVTKLDVCPPFFVENGHKTYLKNYTEIFGVSSNESMASNLVFCVRFFRFEHFNGIFQLHEAYICEVWQKDDSILIYLVINGCEIDWMF